jgi:hypothetical protein
LPHALQATSYIGFKRINVETHHNEKKHIGKATKTLLNAPKTNKNEDMQFSLPHLVEISYQS